MNTIKIKEDEAAATLAIKKNTVEQEIAYEKYKAEVDAQIAADIKNNRLNKSAEIANIAAIGINQMEQLNEVVYMNQMKRQNELLKNGTITQEQFDKNKQALEKKAAKRAKTLAIAAAVINTAQAIIAQLSNPTPYVGFALSAAAAVTGALTIAKIQATDYGDGGGGGGATGGSAPSAGTAPSTSFSFTPQTTTPETPPVKTYVISKDVENQQQLDRQILANGTT
jgi:hypothetical protein